MPPAAESPPAKPAMPASAASSTTFAETSLPLRPTPAERIRHRFRRALPARSYLHPALTRRRLLLLALALLLLALVLPLALLLPRAAARAATLPPGAQVHAGDGTFYAVGLGACGVAARDDQLVVAVAAAVYDALGAGTPAQHNPNLNAVCGRRIRARRRGRARAVEVAVVDRCTGCAPGDLDFSPAAFAAVGEAGEGRVPIEWAWV